MAAINSLTYLLYSVLTLTANNKPTTNPSLSEWDVEKSSVNPLSYTDEDSRERTTENPVQRSFQQRLNCSENEHFTDCHGYCQRTCDNPNTPSNCQKYCLMGCVCDSGLVRGPDRKCIKPEECPKKTRAYNGIDSDEIVSAEKDPEIPEESGGCPRTIECSKSCKRQGYKYGLCSGPDNRNCHCYRNWGAEDSEGPRADPDEIVSAEKDPEIPDESGGCPSTIECSKSCKRQGYKYGLCSGPDNRNCHCYRNWGAEDSEGPRGRFSNTGGCPNRKACNHYCSPKRGHCMIRSICFCEYK